MKKHLANFSFLLLFVFAGCSKEKEEVDTAYPVIDVSAATNFPKQCSEIRRGESFVYRARFSDNIELGSSGIDIHHNFDHHSHSTEVEECDPEPKKSPVNPFLLIKTYSIPGGLKTYEMKQEISVPADVDPGDYHFMIRLTDKEGWQTIKGFTVKIK